MTLARAKLLRAGEIRADAMTLVPISGSEAVARARVMGREVVDSKEQAMQIVREAEARAGAIVAEAEVVVAGLRAKAIEEGRAEGAAALSQAWIRLRAEENARDERDLERSLALARILAERILGETLTLEPERIVEIAKQALLQARLARRIKIVAHPADIATLSREAASLELEPAVVELHADPARSRGSLRFETDLGTLDADLAPQLDRLVATLRDGLRAR